MEKEEKKKKVVINGQEIEVPEGYEVVVEGERIRVVPKEDKETVKVVQAGEDVPESVVRTLKSVGLSFNEEKMRENVAKIGQVEYVVSGAIQVLAGMVFIIVGILLLFYGDSFLKMMGIVFVLGGLFSLWIGALELEPLISPQDGGGKEENLRVYPYPKTKRNYTDEEWEEIKEGLIIIEDHKETKKQTKD